MNKPTRLSANFVKTVHAPGYYGDGRGGFGLSLLVREMAAGRLSKSWTQRLRIDGQPFMLGLGTYPIVGLGRARDKALENARIVETGGDPRKAKGERPLTFADAMDLTIDVLRPNWKQGGKAEAQMRYLLTEYAFPHIGKSRIDAITPSEILEFLTPLAISKPSTGVKLKARLNQVFQWAIAQGIRADNPADRNINLALPKANTSREHHKALPFSEVAAAVQTIQQSGAWLGTKLAFRFLVLTAGRSNEIRLAEWSEIDLDAATWTIPTARMKSGREHRVPLATAALEVLDAAQELSDGTGLVFPSSRGRALTDSTISKLLRENGVRAVPHGFRSSFRDWCAEANVDRQTAEAALAHAVGNATEAAYLRSDMFDLRRAAMDAWAEYLGLKPATLDT